MDEWRDVLQGDPLPLLLKQPRRWWRIDAVRACIAAVDAALRENGITYLSGADAVRQQPGLLSFAPNSIREKLTVAFQLVHASGNDRWLADLDNLTPNRIQAFMFCSVAKLNKRLGKPTDSTRTSSLFTTISK